MADLTPEDVEKYWDDLDQGKKAELEARWEGLSPEEWSRRQKLSAEAYYRHQEIADPDTGRRAFGGPQPGSGRPKKARLGERIADLAQGDKAQAVIDALFNGLNSDDERIVLRSAESITKIEAKEAQLQLEEQKYEDMGKDALLDAVGTLFATLEAKGVLPSMEELQNPKKKFDVESTAQEIDGKEDAGSAAA